MMENKTDIPNNKVVKDKHNVNRKKQRSENKSFYMIPFFTDDHKRYVKNITTSKCYQERYSQITFLNQYIREYFVTSENEIKKDAICRRFKLNYKSYENYKIPGRLKVSSNIITNKENGVISKAQEEYVIFPESIEIFVFDTGMCFLCLGIKYENTTGLVDIVKCNAGIARMYKYYKSDDNNKVSFYNAFNNDVCPLASILENMILEFAKGNVDFLPERNQLTSFHSLSFDEKPDDAEDLIKMLSKGWHPQFERDNENKDFEHTFVYNTTANIFWAGNENGVVSLTYGEKDSFSRSDFPNRVLKDYFILFLLANHERDVLLHYSKIIVQNRKKPGKLVKYRREMVNFNVLFAYEKVSLESNYQIFSTRLHDAFMLDSLESDVAESIEVLDSYLTDTNDRKVGGLLSAIGILAILSALVDGTAFVDWVLHLHDEGSLGFTGGHWTVIVFILGAIVFGVYKYIRKKM